MTHILSLKIFNRFLTKFIVCFMIVVSTSRDRSAPTVQQVIKELISKTIKWLEIAVELEMDPTEIERTDVDNSTVKKRLIAVITWWGNNKRPFTWSAVVQVLDSQNVQETILAGAIRQQYLM